MRKMFCEALAADEEFGPPGAIAGVFGRCFAQPSGQALPLEFLDLLAQLDRSKRGVD